MQKRELTINHSIKFFTNELVINKYETSSIKIYKNILNEFQVFTKTYINNIAKITQIEPMHLEAFRSHMKNTLGMTVSLIDRAISCLRTFFKILLKRNIITTNPIENFEHKRLKKRLKPQTLSKQENSFINNELKLKSTSVVSKSQVIVALLSQVAASKNGIINLKWSDINFKNDTIKLRNYRGNRACYPRMSECLKEILQKYKESLKNDENIYVLETLNKRQISTSAFSKLFKKFVKEVENKRFKEILNSKLSSHEKDMKMKEKSITPSLVRNTRVQKLLKSGDQTEVMKWLGLLNYKSISRFA